MLQTHTGGICGIQREDGQKEKIGESETEKNNDRRKWQELTGGQP